MGLGPRACVVRGGLAQSAVGQLCEREIHPALQDWIGRRFGLLGGEHQREMLLPVVGLNPLTEHQGARAALQTVACDRLEAAPRL